MRTHIISGVTRLFSLVTPRVSRVISPLLARILWHLNARRRHTTTRNLEIAYPQLDTAERQALAHESLSHYVRNILEIGMAWHWRESRLMALFDEPVGRHHLDSARAAGKGVIIAAPHFGSWELLNLYMRRDLDGAVLYKPGHNAAFTEVLLDKRSRTGINMVPSSPLGLREIYRHLNNGRTVGILPDQEPSYGDGRFVPFFGMMANTGVLIPRLVQKTGARVVFTACTRDDAGRYRVHIMPADEDINSTNLDTSVAAVNRGVEQCIGIDPAQYLWTYKRWRIRPEGEPPIY